MWKALALSAAFIAIGAIAPAEAATPADLGGDWRGYFDYAGGAAKPATFDVKIAPGAGDAFAGTIVELNSFADEPYAFLLSTVSGRVSASSVHFTKTYVSSGKISHSVTYDGILDSSGRRIMGTWNADGSKGNFEMAR